MTTLRAILLLLTLSCVCNARLFAPPSLEELKSRAKFIGILKPLKTLKTDEAYEGDLHGLKKEDFQGWVTTFEVMTTFKSDVEVGSKLEVLYFSYAVDFGRPNGAMFATFVISPVQRKVITSVDDVTLNQSMHLAYRPNYLGYLTKESNGSYRPATDQYDSKFAFIEIPGQ